MDIKDILVDKYYLKDGVVVKMTALELLLIISHPHLRHAYEPIPLNEDWLVKFGLIKRYLENPFEDEGFDLKEDGSRWYSWVDDGTFNLEVQHDGAIWYEIYSHYRHLKHVHTLQTLYYALTDKELVIIE